MTTKNLSFTSRLLLYLLTADDVLSSVILPHKLRNQLLFGSQSSYRATIYKLQKRGWIQVVQRKQNPFIKLTKKGELEALLAKARLPRPGRWDGKWRMIIYDIPEEARLDRDRLRRLLQRNNFYKLQASVFINPYPLNREAILYLKQTGLISYIRIIRADQLDDDVDLKKRFFPKSSLR